MKTTIGGDRLGSGNKQVVSMRNYERSTHDLGYIWRSSMAPGTLVPFMSEVALPGDSMDIDLNCNAMTLPTIGPLFGSYKVQLDVFLVPIRLYNGKLHMNKLGIGMDMSRVKLPQLELYSNIYPDEKITDNSQINASCIYSYLNIRGIGRPVDEEVEMVIRQFNGIPYLAYWDIYKQYYANKQEERGFMIHTGTDTTGNEILDARLTVNNVYIQDILGSGNAWTGALTIEGTEIVMELRSLSNVQLETIRIFRDDEDILLSTIFESWEQYTLGGRSYVRFWNFSGDIASLLYYVPNQEVPFENPETQPVRLVEFPLDNIDNMRMSILKDVESNTAFIINQTNEDYEKWIYPYLAPLFQVNEGDKSRFAMQFSQEGLGIKTYQSDLFNNWISTEWIDGDNGINAITAVSTSGDEFTIDALNLASKVYVMLNRIAISGGTYDDWLNAVYTHERAGSIENPVYMGSLIKELAFEEVISNAATVDEPLGTLAGRGAMTKKHKGGNIKIKVHEPSYVIGIASITPRIDYSQGNKWDTNLKTMNDLHKPALDAIGYQDLITDQMAWFDTKVDETGQPEFKSAGKQPAWINYMTNVNQTRGSFAEQNDSMWMTLNRRYEVGDDGIEDLTTYIDPSKYNHIFADTRLDAQNFWVQISVGNTARRKMSAKVIPNL